MAPYAIYARQSLDREGAGLAIARQVQDCRDLAERLGLVGEPVVYADNDMSATRSRLRPGYQALLAALCAGTHDTLLIWHNDRLHRRPVELEEFIEIAEATRLAVRVVQTGELDLCTPSGRMVARIVGAVARHEVEHKGARRQRSNRQRAERGEHTGSTRGFGYGRAVVVNGVRHDRDLRLVNRREAAAIRDAARRMCAGESTTAIWRGWNAAGLLTPKGGQWEAGSFATTMRRPGLAGFMVYRGEVVAGVTAKAPAILTLDEYRGVQAVFARRALGRRGSGPRPVRALLDRIALCGTCGQPMRSLMNRGRKQLDGTRRQFVTYSCPSRPVPGHCAIVVDTLDAVVEPAVIDAVANMQRDARPADPEPFADIANQLAQTTGTITVPVDVLAFRCLHSLAAITVPYWPTWFTTAHPALATAMLRDPVRRAFAEQPLLTRQAIVRATVRVVVSPRATGQRIRVTVI